MADALVPDPVVAEEFGVTLMTIWRWDRDPRKIADGWPPRVKIGTRNYRHRSRLEQYKKNLLQIAIADRDALVKYQRGDELPVS